MPRSLITSQYVFNMLAYHKQMKVYAVCIYSIMMFSDGVDHVMLGTVIASILVVYYSVMVCDLITFKFMLCFSQLSSGL